MKIEIEYTEDDLKFVKDILKPYLKYINETPELTSLLYDLDLLPEQIKLPVNAGRALVITKLFQQLNDKENKTPVEQS